MTEEECEELRRHQNDPDEWSDEAVEIEVRPLNRRRMPKLQDTNDIIVCPLCHGQGHTTGKAIYAVIDGLMGKIAGFLTDTKVEVTHSMMRRLWRARDNS